MQNHPPLYCDWLVTYTLILIGCCLLSAAKISSPVLRLNCTEEGIVVRLKPPRLLVQKMQSSLQYKIYLKHSSGEEVHM